MATSAPFADATAILASMTPTRVAVCVGIDFGTRTCSAALQCSSNNTQPIVDIQLSDPEHTVRDGSLLPSYVSVTPTGFLVGADAMSRARSGDTSTVFDFVRLVGRKTKDLSSAELRKWPFRVVAGANDKAIVEISDSSSVRNGTTPSTISDANAAAVRSFEPEELVAVLFRHIKECTEAQVQAPVDAAVVSIPGGFNRTQRHAVRSACAIAGLRCDALVSAATAVVAAFTVAGTANGTLRDGSTQTQTQQSRQQQLVLAVDVGASCTDVALVAVRRATELDVKATDADLRLGGDDFTDRIAAHCRRRRRSAVTTTTDTAAAALAKTKLTSTTPTITATPVRPTSDSSAAAATTQIRRAAEVAKKVLSLAHTAVVQIDAPAADAFACYTLTRTSFEALCTDLWQQVLARATGVVRDSSKTRNDVSTVLLLGGSVHIPRLAALFYAAFTNSCVLVSPRNVTPARGAAALGAQQSRLTLQDVTPLALGIQSGGGTRVVMIRRNAPLPVRETSLYYANCESAVVVHVLEGRTFSASNGLHCLASIPVASNRAASQLVLQVDLTFDVPSLDRVDVTIVDRTSGRRISTRITADETSMSPAAVTRAHARLHGRIADSTAVVLVPRDSVLQIPHLTGASLLSTQDPIRLLHEYVAALEAAARAGKLLSHNDAALVRAVATALRTCRLSCNDAAAAAVPSA